jgi:hypothetical protein
MKHYSPTGRRNYDRPLKRLLDTWDRNGSTSGPTPWQIDDDDESKQDATMYQNFIIPYLYEAKHVLGDTPPIIRSLKLHWQPLVFDTWKVVGRVVGGRCQVHDHSHTMYSSGNIDVRNWVHLL